LRGQRFIELDGILVQALGLRCGGHAV
jgi:hypothetical protein